LGVQITSNTSWSLTIPREIDWVKASATTGTGDATVNITTTSNPSCTDPRTATITLETAEGTSVTLDIKQEAGPESIVVTPDRLEFPAAGGSLDIGVNSNAEFYVYSPDLWFSIASFITNGNYPYPSYRTEGTVHVYSNISNNNMATSPRSTTITFTTRGGASHTITVYQEGAEPQKRAIPQSSLGKAVDNSSWKPDTTIVFPMYPQEMRDLMSYLGEKCDKNPWGTPGWPIDLRDANNWLTYYQQITIHEHLHTIIKDEIIQELTGWYNPDGTISVSLSEVTSETLSGTISGSVEAKGSIGVVSGSASVTVSATKAATTAQGLTVQNTIDLREYEAGKQYKVVLIGTLNCWYFTFEENTDKLEQYPFVTIDTSTLRVVLISND
jgi:hypothetical protein